MLIGIFYEFKNPDPEFWKVFSYMGSIVIFFLLVCFFIFVLAHYFKYRDKRYDENGKFQVFYQGIRETRCAKFYTSFFLIRRSILALIVFIPNVWFQLVSIVIVQFSSLMYVAIVRPFITFQDNIINCLNELIIVICTGIFISIYKNEGSDDGAKHSVRAVIYIVSFSGAFVCVIILSIASYLLAQFV